MGSGEQPGMATALFEVTMSSPGNRPPPLTVEERCALSLSATGRTVTEVGEAMGTSPEVVRLWLASVIEKLGARSKLEAVLIAARRGVLDLDPGDHHSHPDRPAGAP